MIRQMLKRLHKGIVWLMILPVRLYQLTLSPLLPNSCRHIPTCSEYAIQALNTHGIFRGSLLSAWRILRCNPWGTHGYDPVPPGGSWRRRKQDAG